MPAVSLDQATIDRPDDLRVDDATNGEIIKALVGIYESTKMTLAFGGDEYV